MGVKSLIASNPVLKTSDRKIEIKHVFEFKSEISILDYSSRIGAKKF